MDEEQRAALVNMAEAAEPYPLTRSRSAPFS
jgi:hypothetical protein